MSQKQRRSDLHAVNYPLLECQWFRLFWKPKRICTFVKKSIFGSLKKIACFVQRNFLYLWGQIRVRLVSCHDCSSHALREINSRGRLGGTVVESSDLQSASPSSIPGRIVSNISPFFLLLEVNNVFLFLYFPFKIAWYINRNKKSYNIPQKHDKNSLPSNSQPSYRRVSLTK